MSSSPWQPITPAQRPWTASASRWPPFRETQNYVEKVGRVTGKAASATPKRRTTAPKALIYRVVDLVDGRPVARYTTERPTTGTYEVIQP